MLDRSQIVAFLVSELGVDSAKVSDDTPLFSSGLIDSFSLVRLLGFIESKAQIRIEPTDVSLDNMDTISRILRFVAQAAAG